MSIFFIIQTLKRLIKYKILNKYSCLNEDNIFKNNEELIKLFTILQEGEEDLNTYKILIKKLF